VFGFLESMKKSMTLTLLITGGEEINPEKLFAARPII